MKKFLQNIKSALDSEQKNDDEKDLSNHIMHLIFDKKDTVSSIRIFKEVKRKVHNEIAKRGIDGLIEHANCEEYFDIDNKEKLTKISK